MTGPTTYIRIAARAVLLGTALFLFSCNAASNRSGISSTPEPAAPPKPVHIHPSFDLTLSGLKELTADTRPDIHARIMARPQYFLELMKKELTGSQDLFWLVDKSHALPADYRPADLAALSDYEDRLTLNRADLVLRAVVMPDLLAMVEAARQDGVVLPLSSTFRSYQYQDALFSRYVREEGEAKAERESARPGHSQHQLGTTIDFGSVTAAFAQSAAGRWLEANAGHFGFSMSYPPGMEEVTGYIYESWHFRYVGRVATTLQQEFFDNVQQYALAFYQSHHAQLAEHLLPAGG